MRNSLNKRKYMSPKQLEAFQTRVSALENSRNRFILNLMMATGARPSEILNLRVEDLDEETESVWIKGLKNSNDHDVPLHPDLFKELRSFIRSRDLIPTAKVFDIGYQRLVQIFKSIAPKGHSLRSLRHTFAVELYKKTRDVQFVQDILGHKSIHNTMVYAKHVRDQSEIRERLLGVGG